MLWAKDPKTGLEYVVTRERGGEHGVELVDRAGHISVVPSLEGWPTEFRDRPIRSDQPLLPHRREGWLGKLRAERTEFILQSIRGRAKARRVDKGPGVPKAPRAPRAPGSPRQTKAKAEIAANRALIEANLSKLPPEVQAQIRANLNI